MRHQRGERATRTAPIGRGSSWQPDSDIVKSCIAMRQKSAAAGGWSRFETNTAATAVERAGMAAILNETLPALRKAWAAARGWAA